jgi:hypothetical protein
MPESQANKTLSELRTRLNEMQQQVVVLAENLAKIRAQTENILRASQRELEKSRKPDESKA